VVWGYWKAAEKLVPQLNEEVSESENIKSALHEAETKFETQMASLREQFELQLSKSTAEVRHSGYSGSRKSILT
jgi:hypothetical protein